MSDVIETTKVEIDGFEYTLQALDTVKARKVLFTVLGVVSPTMTAAAKANSIEDAFANGLDAVIKALPESTYSQLCDTFGMHTIVHLPDGREPQLKDVAKLHFSRRLSAEVRWLFECCKFNFADFLDGKALGKDFRALLAKQSKFNVPQKSTGSSSGS